MKKIWLILGLFLVLPIRAFAYTGSASLTCSQTSVSPGDTFTCTVNINSTDPITDVEIPIVLGEGVSIVGTSIALSNNAWNGNDISGNKIGTNFNTPLQGEIVLGTLTFKIADNATAGTTSIGLSNMVFYNDTAEYNNIPNHSTSITITAGSVTPPEPVETGLRTLTVTGGSLSPSLTDDNFAYMITLPSSATTFSISAIAKNTSDSITATNVDTSESVNLSNITFRTTSGSSMGIRLLVGSVTYDIVVVKEVEDTVGEPELASLIVGGITVQLASCIQNSCVVTLDDVSSYTIVATLADSEHYKFSENTMMNMNQLSGEREVPIQIVPKDTTQGLSDNTYIITIQKKAGGSSGGGSVTPSNNETPSNPKTSGRMAIVMGIVLIISFAASLYLYKRNMNSYNN